MGQGESEQGVKEREGRRMEGGVPMDVVEEGFVPI